MNDRTFQGLKQTAMSEKYGIGETMANTFANYVVHGFHGGSFFEAVMTNNLMGAFGRCDAENGRNLKNILMFVHWEIPGTCHGSPEIYKAWCESKQKEAEKSAGKTVEGDANDE